MPGPFVFPASGTLSGIPLAAYRADLASRLGEYERLTVSTTAASGDAARLVIADEVRDDEEERARWAGGYLYAAGGTEAGVQRRILRDGYEGPQGALRVSRPFASPLRVGTPVELTRPLPVKRHLGVVGIDDCVNEALDRIVVEARIPFTGNGSHAYDLSPYPFIQRPDQIDGVYDWLAGSASTDNPVRSAATIGLRQMGSTRYLETDWLYATSDSFQVAVLVSARRLVKQNGSWGYSDGGLVADDDEAAAPLDWVRAFGMLMALRHTMDMTVRDRTLEAPERNLRLATLAADRRRWALAAADIKLHSMPQPRAGRVRGIVAVPTDPNAVPDVVGRMPWWG
jgi:hypothetical protein